MEILIPFIVIILAVAGIYAFGFSAFIAEKITEILRIEKDSFLEWLVLAIFVGIGLGLFYFLTDMIFGIF
tara:strand:+ start:118 stop:327 length:210 start_codon:yes stop_codon:yes gene_type:complete